METGDLTAKNGDSLGCEWDIPWGRHRKKCGKALVSIVKQRSTKWWLFHIFLYVPGCFSWFHWR
jgi:hypothetical protein